MEPFRPGLDSNNTRRFKREKDADAKSPLLEQRESDKSLVRKLLGKPDHALIRLLRREIKTMTLPLGTTTTERILITSGATSLVDSLVEILEETDDA